MAESTTVRTNTEEYLPAAITAGVTDNCLWPEHKKAGCTVTLKITAGTGSIQTTTSGAEAVVAGTAEWVTTYHGVKAATFSAEIAPVTAIRGVWGSGTVQLSVKFF